MKRLTKHTAMALAILFVLSSCSYFGTVQSKWSKLTPNEKSRVVIGSFQDELDVMFTTGKQYVATKPELQEGWKTKVLPLFSAANQATIVALQTVDKGTSTPDEIYKNIGGLVMQIKTVLINMGVNL